MIRTFELYLTHSIFFNLPFLLICCLQNPMHVFSFLCLQEVRHRPQIANFTCTSMLMLIKKHFNFKFSKDTEIDMIISSIFPSSDPRIQASLKSASSFTVPGIRFCSERFYLSNSAAGDLSHRSWSDSLSAVKSSKVSHCSLRAFTVSVLLGDFRKRCNSPSQYQTRVSGNWSFRLCEPVQIGFVHFSYPAPHSC